MRLTRDSRKLKARFRRQLAEIDVVVDPHGLEETIQLAIFGDVTDAVIDRLLGHPVADRFAAQIDHAAIDQIALQRAENDLGDLRASGPDQAGDADNFAGINRQRHILHHRTHRHVLDDQHFFGAVMPLLSARYGHSRSGVISRPTM